MAVTKSEGDGNHPSSHYLVVEDSTKPTTWHLRVRNMSGELDHTLMGAAWAALHGGYRGNKYAGPNKEEALRKLKGMYKKEGMPLPGGSKSLVYKDRIGQSWFIGIYSNNFEDREEETFTWDSHLEYAKWVKDTGVKLPVTVMHQPQFPVEVHLSQFLGLSLGKITPQEFSDNYMKMYKPYAFAQTEAVIPLNGFMIVLAKILKGKEHVVELLNKSDWGMSHGYLALNHDEDTYHVYRSFEFTSLPSSLAANGITLSKFTIKELEKMDNLKGLNEEDRKTLADVLQADPTELEEATRAAHEILSKFLSSKEIATPEEETPEEDAPVTEEPNEYEELREKIFGDLGVEQLHKSFTQIVETLQSLESRVAAMDTRVKQTERSEDEKVASQFYMPNWDVWNKGIGETEDEPDLEALKKDAIGEKPVKGVKSATNSENPLVFGWMKPMGMGE